MWIKIKHVTNCLFWDEAGDFKWVEVEKIRENSV